MRAKKKREEIDQFDTYDLNNQTQNLRFIPFRPPPKQLKSPHPLSLPLFLSSPFALLLRHTCT